MRQHQHGQHGGAADDEAVETVRRAETQAGEIRLQSPWRQRRGAMTTAQRAAPGRGKLPERRGGESRRPGDLDREHAGVLCRQHDDRCCEACCEPGRRIADQEARDRAAAPVAKAAQRHMSHRMQQKRKHHGGDHRQPAEGLGQDDVGPGKRVHSGAEARNEIRRRKTQQWNLVPRDDERQSEPSHEAQRKKDPFRAFHAVEHEAHADSAAIERRQHLPNCSRG